MLETLVTIIFVFPAQSAIIAGGGFFVGVFWSQGRKWADEKKSEDKQTREP